LQEDGAYGWVVVLTFRSMSNLFHHKKTQYVFSDYQPQISV
jgi:hypothetical protein